MTSVCWEEVHLPFFFLFLFFLVELNYTIFVSRFYKGVALIMHHTPHIPPLPFQSLINRASVAFLSYMALLTSAAYVLTFTV